MMKVIARIENWFPTIRWIHFVYDLYTQLPTSSRK
jgi:hypothetical protein